MRWLSWLVLAVQLALFTRFIRRAVASVNGTSIPLDASDSSSSTVVIVPVLNEADRLEPCLRSLTEQDGVVREILVVDGGSTDGTRDLICSWEKVDQRIRVIDAPPAPEGWNGKAWGLESGFRAISQPVDWVLTVDADVRVYPQAARRVTAFAGDRQVPVLSVACCQIADTPGLSLVHPSLLATLVYRFGAPGRLAADVRDVQSNGQFGLYRHDVLTNTGGFASARDSICEDVTLARHLYLAGYDVGFYDGDTIAETEMYASGGECLRNWPRSLSLRDRILPGAGVLGLLNILFLQVIPLFFLVRQIRYGSRSTGLGLANRVLIATRLGILFGSRRAYSAVRWTYWISPLADPLTFLSIAANLVRRSHTWRGLELVPATVQSEPRKGSYNRCV